MAKEIERKFLVTEIPAFITSQYRAVSILQGYISEGTSSRQVRIRSKGEHYYLTVKDSGLLEREEVEITLSAEQFHALWPLTQKRFIRKKRFEVPYDQYTIELDVFEDKLSGLIIAEVEFASIEESDKLTKPDWFGKEVTHDLHYANSQLASSQQIPDARI
ncbi:CYTH domain-containing protein [Catalinimonas niigatensis]|uniref:CYTH domain-containing protein n=1 Tax=Catalinimonas niigatensis TaxID=1397264 RepID=UPI002666A83A|nr:CYTH domain-containing protein [Catalinimonas niigatensis]WPP48647.1 CYTH domain-containing protein [Catalinimonas niigatensis]